VTSHLPYLPTLSSSEVPPALVLCWLAFSRSL
jgi:hypothetical protein